MSFTRACETETFVLLFLSDNVSATRGKYWIFDPQLLSESS